MKIHIEAQHLYIGEEDKTGWCSGVEAECYDGEECALHIKSHYDGIPFASLYLTPIDAALLGAALIQSAKEIAENE